MQIIDINKKTDLNYMPLSKYGRHVSKSSVLDLRKYWQFIRTYWKLFFIRQLKSQLYRLLRILTYLFWLIHYNNMSKIMGEYKLPFSSFVVETWQWRSQFSCFFLFFHSYLIIFLSEIWTLQLGAKEKIVSFAFL